MKEDKEDMEEPEELEGPAQDEVEDDLEGLNIYMYGAKDGKYLGMVQLTREDHASILEYGFVQILKNAVKKFESS